MSYCRWSDDDFTSDIYVYATFNETWAIHVARNRHLPTGVPGPGPLPHPDDGTEAFAQWADRNRAFMDALREAERVPIDLPYAGATFDCVDPGHAATTLEMLQGLGYHVPAGVIDELKREWEEVL